MDVDGTLTDGKIYMGVKGEKFKAFSIKDGYSISNVLPQYNIAPVVITGRDSEIVNYRCKELGINYVFQSVVNKKEKLLEFARQQGLSVDEDGIIQEIAYIGDDLPDYECMKIAKFAGCPKDAVEEIKGCANFISSYNGGEGAVREFIEWIINCG